MARVYNANTYASGPSNPFGTVTPDTRDLTIQATTVTAPTPPPTGGLGFVTGKDKFGVTTFPAYGSDPSQHLDDAKAVGARWVRLDSNTGYLANQGPNGPYNWGNCDSLVSKATARGFKILLVLAFTPGWAGGGDKYGLKTQAAWDGYATVSKAIVDRYKPGGSFGSAVAHYEFWNEPNLAGFWNGIRYQDYANALKATYLKIKGGGANPSICIVGGATSNASNNGSDIHPLTFLTGVYDTIGAGYFDAWSHHPYTHPAIAGSPGYGASTWGIMDGNTPSIRSIMVARGDSGKAIWATELGAPTTPNQGFTQAGAQAQVEAYYRDLLPSKAYFGPGFFYTVKDDLTGGAALIQNYGMNYDNFAPKPLWQTYLNRVNATP